MAYNGTNFGNDSGSGNVWSGGSRGGSRGGGYSRSNNNDDDNRPRGGGSYRGSFGNNNTRRGGYGFRRQGNNTGDRGEMETLKDAIFIQNLPKNVTRDEILDAFSTVGQIKTDERSGGPKIWIYKDRTTGEGTGRATVTYESDETASKAVEEYNDQHINTIDSVVRVQLAQRRNRNEDNFDHGGRGGYRGGRRNWDNNNSRQGFNSTGGRWSNANGGFSDSRDGPSNNFQDDGGDSFRNDDDRGNSYRNNRGTSYRGASRGNSGASNYSPY